MSIGDSKDMKISDEYSKSTLTYLKECQVGHFKLVGVHIQKEKRKMIENDLTQK